MISRKQFTPHCIRSSLRHILSQRDLFFIHLSADKISGLHGQARMFRLSTNPRKETSRDDQECVQLPSSVKAGDSVDANKSQVLHVKMRLSSEKWDLSLAALSL